MLQLALPWHALAGRRVRAALLVTVSAILGSLVGRAAESETRVLRAEHGVVCRLPGERFGYFAWPTVARMDDGTLLVVSSGLRSEHVCPFGKTVLNVSRDDGRTWSPSRESLKAAARARTAPSIHEQP